MALILARNYNNMYDLVKGDNLTRNLIEVAQKSCPIIEDMPMLAGTEPSGNKTILRTGYPRGSWTALYEGVDAHKTDVKEVVDECGNLEDYLIIPENKLNMADNKAKYLAEEQKGFMVGLGGNVEETAFYGKKNSKSFAGFAQRYNTLDVTKDISKYVINAGGSSAGAMTSIYFIIWSPLTAFGFHGKNAPAGLSQHPEGIKTVASPVNDKNMRAYVEHFIWNIGLAVSDYRSVVRIANIDLSDDTLDIDALMLTAYNKIKNKKMGVGMIYMNEDAKTFIDIKRSKKNNVYYQPVEWNGNEIEGWRGFGVRTADMLLSTEDVVA
jgi:hypothetical protein